MTSNPPEIALARQAEMQELAEGLEHASRVAWRWLRDDESPWDRALTLRMVAGLSRMAAEARAHLIASEEVA